MQDMFNWYCTNPKFEDNNLDDMVEMHERELPKVFEYMLYGIMIGTELVWRKIKNCGKALILTTLAQSLGTFVLVSLAFDTVFYFSGVPVYLAFIFGGIALATAPAPALRSIPRFYRNCDSNSFRQPW